MHIFFSPSAQLTPPAPNANLWGWVWSTEIHVYVSPAMMIAWASGKISPCTVVCVCGILRRNMACKHVADHHILRGSSIHLQLDMSCLFSRDCKPRVMCQRPANMILFEHPRWCSQGWLGVEDGETVCHEMTILAWWWTKRKGKGKESQVCNHFIGCTRITGVLGCGWNSVRCSDRPYFIRVPAWKLGYNPDFKITQTFKNCRLWRWNLHMKAQPAGKVMVLICSP